MNKHKWKLFEYHNWGNRIGWITILGYGIHLKDKRNHPPLFSERNGYRKWHYIGNLGFRFLTPNR